MNLKFALCLVLSVGSIYAPFQGHDHYNIADLQRKQIRDLTADEMSFLVMYQQYRAAIIEGMTPEQQRAHIEQERARLDRRLAEQRAAAGKKD